MKRSTSIWDTLLVATMLIIASVCAQAQAQEAEEGKVVTIDADADAIKMEVETRIVAEPSYWIGIRGRSIESVVLRTHLQLAEDMGVVVEEVLEGSPAAKAGLRKHDIILRANGDGVDNMQVLQQQVTAGKEKPIELKIIRLGKKDTLVIVPEPRPEEVRLNGDQRLDRFQRGDRQGDIIGEMMKQFGGREFGPGMVFRGGGQVFDLNQMPNGISVSVQRNNNEPPQITVKKGGQTWTVVGDDPESLKQLPADLRPFVERMLNGQNQVQIQGFGGNFGQGFGGNFDMGNLNKEIEKFIPRDLGGFGGRGDALRERFDKQEIEMRERMERLEQRLKQLQNRLQDEEIIEERLEGTS